MCVCICMYAEKEGQGTICLSPHPKGERELVRVGENVPDTGTRSTLPAYRKKNICKSLLAHRQLAERGRGNAVPAYRYSSFGNQA